MTTERVCLTLVVGRTIREELFEFLSQQTELASGFTASEVEGHGPSVRLHSATERVKGRADRVLVRTILEATAASELIARMQDAFAGAHLVYWTTPVLLAGVID
jgi:Protein of unknown function (DUF3240)